MDHDLKFQPARREKLADTLYGQILEQFATGILKLGDKLPSEAEIAGAFGVSRPVVRQALNRLRADGIIHSRQGAGSFVTRVPSAHLTDFTRSSDIADTFRSLEARLALEPNIARLAAERRSRAQMAAIAAAMKALKAAFADGTPGEDEDFAFHRAVAEATDNAIFVELLETIGGRTRRFMSTALGLTRLGSEERRRQVLHEHTMILDAIEARDGETARLTMAFHLTQARARVRDSRRDR